MAVYGHGIRDQLKNNVSYSSLPAGLEIAVAPNDVMSPPEKKSRYSYKPLPPLPPLSGKSLNQDMGQSRPSDFIGVDASARDKTLPFPKHRDRRKSIRKIATWLPHDLDYAPQQTTFREASRTRKRERLPQVPDIVRLPKLDHHDRVDGFEDIRQFMRSDSELSLTSTSAYSEDNTVEDIVESYSKRFSWAPVGEFPASLSECPLYMQPSMYSASATGLGHSDYTAYVRRPNYASIDGTQISPNSKTLAELITEERACYGSEIYHNRSHRSQETKSSFQDDFSSEAITSRYPTWNKDDVYRRALSPQPLALRPKRVPEHHRSMSRWSDNSSEGGMISNARDSMVSHLRNLSSPFKVPSQPPMVSKEKALTLAIQLPVTGDPSRKGAFSDAKHPLKSPFPTRSPHHKKSHSSNSQTPAHSTFTRRISDSFRHSPRARPFSPIKPQVISNYARKGDGPDTPMPTTAMNPAAMMGLTSPTAILFQKGAERFQDAVQKAKRAAKIKSRDERRRDKLRRKIVVIGRADTAPAVSRWV